MNEKETKEELGFTREEITAGIVFKPGHWLIVGVLLAVVVFAVLISKSPSENAQPAQVKPPSQPAESAEEEQPGCLRIGGAIITLFFATKAKKMGLF